MEAPEIGWDFENETEARTIDEHLAPFAERVHKKWGCSPCFVDFNLIGPDERMDTGIHPVRFVFDRLQDLKCSGIPVTGLDRDHAYQQETRDVVTQNRSGVCLRITIEQAAKNSFREDLDILLATLNTDVSNCGFILDLGTPNFEPVEGFSAVIQAIVSRLPYLGNWRIFTILGTSFPDTMASIRKGGEVVPRYEWRLYKKLAANFQEARLRLPTFGDYAISHPQVLQLDMRKVKPSATIRYAVDNAWYIVKGENVRDEKFGKFKQYRGLSKKIVDSRYYFGSTFSWGDYYIWECANGTGNTGNLMMWRQVGTNHHIEKVTQDIANFYAS
jgi:hypothetical protein